MSKESKIETSERKMHEAKEKEKALRIQMMELSLKARALQLEIAAEQHPAKALELQYQIQIMRREYNDIEVKWSTAVQALNQAEVEYQRQLSLLVQATRSLDRLNDPAFDKSEISSEGFEKARVSVKAVIAELTK